MKGQAIFQLLMLLREETDENHRLTQQNLLDRMKQRYDVQLNRRTLKVYLDALAEAGYSLCSTKKQRTLPDGSVETMHTDWYMEPQFEPGELRMMTDLLSAMPSLPDKQRNMLVDKLTQGASPTYRESAQESHVVYLHAPAAKQMLYTVEVLCEAITRNCTVQFRYGNYVLNEDGEPVLQPRTRSDGSVREYLVSPYEIVVSHGKYYLMCCKEPHRTVSHYRIDHIMDIRLTEQFERMPLSETLEQSTEHPRDLAEQLYMYSGSSVPCKFLADINIIGDVLDWFGDDATFEQTIQDQVIVHVRTNPTALHHWALQYGDYVTVLEPVSLREAIGKTVHRLARAYEDKLAN